MKRQKITEIKFVVIIIFIFIIIIAEQEVYFNRKMVNERLITV